jgi:NADH:ubiquinone oxidoreductase subunit F (NADH-binding)
LCAPHRILDGAAITAKALGVTVIHVVCAGDRPAVADTVTAAVAERKAAGERLRWRVLSAEGVFVAGQARAVLELLDGRPGLPVTAWVPESRSGLRGRPTLLSNAETFAQLGELVRLGPQRYAALGTPQEPGTTLLTVVEEGAPTGDEAQVLEVAHGTPWSSVLGDRVDQPVLTGGYHGTWAAPGQLAGLTVSRLEMAAAGLALGAGVALVARSCPLQLTARITTYLAEQSAGRCGPCRLGLPELATEMRLLGNADPGLARSRVLELTRLVTGRGACAHPDGTARLVRSALDAFDDEVGRHLTGRCGWSDR